MTETLAQTVPAALRAELGRQSITRVGLANRLGKGRDWVDRRLNLEVQINLDDLDLMCQGLGLIARIELAPAPPAPPAPAKTRKSRKTAAASSGGRRPRTPQPASMEGVGQ